MEKSSFFNSIAGDRKYKAEDFASFFNSLLTNGAFPNPSTNLQIISNNNMTVTVKAGKAWINGYIYILDADMILPIEVADGVLKRIDRIVIRFSTIGRSILGGIRKGVFASSPVAPALQRDADLYELGIADIYVANGSVSISQANITDLRMNTTYCGWVNSLIQADTTAIFNQYQAWFTAQSNTYNTNMTASELAFNTNMIASEAQFQDDFETWFATIQGQLNGDIAGNLTNAININTAAIATNASNLTSHLADNVQHPSYVVTTGTANAYVVTLNPIPTSYVDGMGLCVKINVLNTGASTINVNGLGIVAIKDSSGNALVGNKLLLNSQYEIRYESVSGCFKMLGSSSLPVNLFIQTTDPGVLAQNNDLWFDISATRLIKFRAAGVWVNFDSTFS